MVTIISEILMNKQTMQEIAQNGLIIETPYGNVNASTTATVWGEDPNITGFAMSHEPATHTIRQANAMHPGFGDKATAWAENQAQSPLINS